MATLEETVTDSGSGQVANATLSDYLVAVNADVPASLSSPRAVAGCLADNSLRPNANRSRRQGSTLILLRRSWWPAIPVLSWC
jgi:hypothetical protein